jgi:ABC-type uncharacterized transport system permease subunit
MNGSFVSFSGLYAARNYAIMRAPNVRISTAAGEPLPRELVGRPRGAVQTSAGRDAMSTFLTTGLGTAAVAAYFVATYQAARGTEPAPHRSPMQASLAIAMSVALILHATTLYGTMATPQGINLGVFNAASLVACLMVSTLFAILLRQPLNNVATVLMPLAACGLMLDLSFPSAHIVPDDAAAGLVWHIALAMVAYSLIAIAAIQAVFIALAEYKLRHHHRLQRFLPPLQTMETLLFQLVTIAFVLLSFSLVAGAAVVHDIREQHLAHKVFFSILAWFAFALLLWGRWRFGWRGTRAVRYVLVGTGLLALGYFGSKIVLELILRRA